MSANENVQALCTVRPHLLKPRLYNIFKHILVSIALIANKRISENWSHANGEQW